MSWFAARLNPIMFKTKVVLLNALLILRCIIHYESCFVACLEDAGLFLEVIIKDYGNKVQKTS